MRFWAFDIHLFFLNNTPELIKINKINKIKPSDEEILKPVEGVKIEQTHPICKAPIGWVPIIVVNDPIAEPLRWGGVLSKIITLCKVLKHEMPNPPKKTIIIESK